MANHMIPLPDNDDLILQDLVEHANHSPKVTDQIMLVAVLERVTRAVAALAEETQRAEHVAAAGYMRSALSLERKVLDGMKRLSTGMGINLS